VDHRIAMDNRVQMSRKEALFAMVESLNDTNNRSHARMMDDALYYTFSNEIIPIDLCIEADARDAKKKHFPEHYDLQMPDHMLIREQIDSLNSKNRRVLLEIANDDGDVSIFKNIFKMSDVSERCENDDCGEYPRYFGDTTEDFEYDWVDCERWGNVDVLLKRETNNDIVSRSDKRIFKSAQYLNADANSTGNAKNDAIREAGRNMKKNGTTEYVPNRTSMDDWCPQSLFYFVISKNNMEDLEHFMRSGRNTLKSITKDESFWNTFDVEFKNNVDDTKTSILGRCIDAGRISNAVANSSTTPLFKFEYFRKQADLDITRFVGYKNSNISEISERYRLFYESIYGECHKNASEMMRHVYRLRRLCHVLNAPCEMASVLASVVRSKYQQRNADHDDRFECIADVVENKRTFDISIAMLTIVSDIRLIQHLECDAMITDEYFKIDVITYLKQVVCDVLTVLCKTKNPINETILKYICKQFGISQNRATVDENYANIAEKYGVIVYNDGERVSKSGCYYIDSRYTSASRHSRSQWYKFFPLDDDRAIWIVRKDVMCLLHATNTLKTLNNSDVVFENITKHWSKPSNKHSILDRMRKWCSMCAVLNWISDKRSNQYIGDIIPPDHPDFDDMFDILNDIIQYSSNSNGLMEELIKYAYANPYKPSLLRGLSSFLRIKKHHVVDRSIIRCIRAYLIGDDATVLLWLKEKAIRYLPKHMIIPLLVELNDKLKEPCSERSKNVTPHMFTVLETLDQVKTISDRLVQYVDLRPGVEYSAFVESQGGTTTGKRGIKRKIECFIYDDFAEPCDDETRCADNFNELRTDSNASAVVTTIGSSGKIVKKRKTKKKNSVRRTNVGELAEGVGDSTDTFKNIRKLELPEMSDDFIRSSAKISTECYIKSPSKKLELYDDVKEYLGCENGKLQELLRKMARLEKNGIEHPLSSSPMSFDDESDYNICEKDGFIDALISCIASPENNSDVFTNGSKYYIKRCNIASCGCSGMAKKSYDMSNTVKISELRKVFENIWDTYIDGDCRTNRSFESNGSRMAELYKHNNTTARAYNMRESSFKYTICRFIEKCKHVFLDYGCVSNMLSIINDDERHRRFEDAMHPFGYLDRQRECVQGNSNNNIIFLLTAV